MATRPRGSLIETICRFTYELAALLAVATLILCSIHGTAVYHSAIDEVIDGTHVGATVDQPERFEVGKSYPLFRYNQEWEAPVGELKVDTILDKRVVFSFDPAALRWPMGRHARIIGADGVDLRINIGSNSGFKPGDVLSMYDGRLRVGGVELVYTWPHESIGRLAFLDAKYKPSETVGKTLSEYTFATQVMSFDAPMIEAFEYVTIFGILIGYVLFWWRFKASPLSVLGPKLASHVQVKPWLKLVWHAVIGPPAVWFGTALTVHMIAYLIEVIYGRFNLGQIPHFITLDAMQHVELPLAILLAIGYEVLLFLTKVSPFYQFAQRIRFKGGLFGHEARDVWEHIGIWCMQAVIVYAFARMLSGFFQGNLQLAMDESWPTAPRVIVPDVNPISPAGFMRSAVAIGYALTHNPKPPTQDLAWATLRGFINNACIIGGLFGYTCSMLGYLWGKRIRNVDFTVPGWVLNAICYAPLLGVVFWRMVPNQVGPDPILTSGFLRTDTFVVEALTNVVYTISIWNLGSMFGVMTDKGVRTTGFYSVVRHPSYTIEALMFMLVFCRGLSGYLQWTAVFGYLLLYWLRSEREDQFMTASNPEYTEYKQRVPYKFLPGVY